MISFSRSTGMAMWVSASLVRLLAVYLLCGAVPLHAAETVMLVAGQRAPYIGEDLPGEGYVYEVVQAAFLREGYRTSVAYYPLARANLILEKAEVDGLIPAYLENPANPTLLYSDPFPGDTLCLIKRKSLQLTLPEDGARDINGLLRALSPYTLGVVRGGLSLPALDAANGLKKQQAQDDLQNLDNLYAGSVQLALIDKYTAADLMTGQRPQMIGALDIVSPPLAQRDFHIAFPKQAARSARLLAAFNTGLRAITRDGTLARIRAKHGLLTPLPSRSGKVTLTIATVANHDMVVMQALSANYTKLHPNIELSWRVLEENTLRTRLLSDLAISDGQFDVMTIGTYEAPLWAQRGWLQPFAHLPEAYEVDDLLPTVRAGLSYDGKLYALPFYAESSMTFYRRDLFAKAGITMPAKPTYDDIAHFAAKLNDPGAGVYGICLRGKPGWGENMAFLSTLVNAYGGQWFNLRWMPQIDSAAWRDAVGYYTNLMNHYGPPHADENGFTENLALFASGHCGIWIDATVAAGLLYDPKQSKVWHELGYAPAPIAVTDRGTAWLWSWALAVPSSSSHPVEAQDFVAWATSKGYIQAVADAQGWVTVPPGTRKSTYQNPQYLKAAPFAQFVYQAIETADIANATLKPKPYQGIQVVEIPEFAAIGNQVGAEIAKSLRGEESVPEALARAQALTARQMALSGYLK